MPHSPAVLALSHSRVGVQVGNRGTGSTHRGLRGEGCECEQLLIPAAAGEGKVTGRAVSLFYLAVFGLLGRGFGSRSLEIASGS